MPQHQLRKHVMGYIKYRQFTETVFPSIFNICGEADDISFQATANKMVNGPTTLSLSWRSRTKLIQVKLTDRECTFTTHDYQNYAIHVR